jgi:PAS domain S-box-containing protein
MNQREKVNILMVDDQPAKLLSYETILSELGENLVRASSANEALDQLLRKEVGVLLVDVNMPGINGFDLAKIVRGHPRFQKTAIIFVSAISLTDLDRLRAYELGAVDYVPVPVVPEILRAKVSVFVELYRKTKELEQVNSQLETRVAERTAELAASEERFRLATEAMRGGLYDHAPLAGTTWSSAGLEALLGFRPGEQVMSFEWWQNQIHPDDLQAGWKLALSALADPNVPTYDANYRICQRGGKWVWVWDRGRIVRDSQGRATRIVGHVTDISDTKKTEDLLKEADRRKDEFLATLSHELRNPLAPIRNALNIMRTQGATEADVRRSREVIDRQVRHLSRLVDDLLDVSRISRNKLEIRSSRIDLAEAIGAAVEATMPLLEECGHTIEVSLPSSLPMDGDSVRLTQVFTNLLNNSARYTPRGGAISLIGVVEGDEVAIVVKDTGRGIAAEDLERIFQIFYQGSDCPSLSPDGFGIGLALVARIVEMHGGTVKAASGGVNAGSEFVVRLPVLREAVAQSQPEPLIPSQTASAVQRVLVADDSVDSAESLALLLTLQGYEVRTAHEGGEALKVASQFSPDVVLLDIGMPVMNGYDVAMKIREQPWGKNMLLIAQTGWGEDRDRHRSKEAGFDAHLTKPLDYTELAKILSDWGGIARAANH